MLSDRATAPEGFHVWVQLFSWTNHFASTLCITPEMYLSVSLRIIFFSPQRSPALTVVQYLHGNMKTYLGARLEEEIGSWCSMQSLWVMHSLLEVVYPWLWHDWKNCLSTSSASRNEDFEELFEATMEPFFMEFLGSSFSEKGKGFFLYFWDVWD